MFDLVEELVWMHDMQLLIAMMHFSQKNCLSEFTYVFHYRFFDRIAFNESSTPDLQVVQLKISVGSQRYIKTYALQFERFI